MGQKLRTKEMKKIAYEIIESEQKKYNIDIKVFPVTFIDYYSDYIFKGKFNLIRYIKLSLLPLSFGGFNDFQGNTVLFLNNVKKIKKVDGRVFRLAEICYHEARHSVQLTFDKYSYEGFLRCLDDYLLVTANRDYKLEHDKYSFEIGANLYGVIEARDYLKKNYPEFYQKQKDEIEKLLKLYIYKYMMYDASNTIDRVILIAKFRRLVFRKNARFKKKEICEDKISPVLEIFLNKDYSFKKMSEIVKHEKFEALDKRIVYAFFASQSFLKSVNFTELTDEELKIVNKALEYTNRVYKNQEIATEKAVNDNIISSLQCLKTKKSLIKKFNILMNYFDTISSKRFNLYRSERARKKHVKNVSRMFIQTSEMIDVKKSRGVLNFKMLYILGLVIMLFTIGFLTILYRA